MAWMVRIHLNGYLSRASNPRRHRLRQRSACATWLAKHQDDRDGDNGDGLQVVQAADRAGTVVHMQRQAGC